MILCVPGNILCKCIHAYDIYVHIYVPLSSRQYFMYMYVCRQYVYIQYVCRQYKHIFIYYIYVHVCVCIQYIHVSASALQFIINMTWTDKDQNQESNNEKLNPCITSPFGDDHSSFACTCLQYCRVGTEIHWMQVHQIQWNFASTKRVLRSIRLHRYPSHSYTWRWMLFWAHLYGQWL